MFNRYAMGSSHVYFKEFGGSNVFSKIVKGYVKCKLIHTIGESLMVPDLLFLEEDEGNCFKWIQPLSFFGCRLVITDNDNIHCSIVVDISSKQTIEIRFSANDNVRGFDDFSELYKCDIHAFTILSEYATGTGYFKENYEPYIRLYHHTTANAKESIMKSGHFYDSRGNFAGTKELTSIGYLYLTCLDKIINEADLQQVAMSSQSYLFL
jgi:hypothetical protein